MTMSIEDSINASLPDTSSTSILNARGAGSIAQTKKPPQESSESIRVRSLVILSFWIVVLFGLPIWWWTTSIYRARLPLEQMLEWADGKVCSFLKIRLSAGLTRHPINKGMQAHLPIANYHRCTFPATR